MSFHKFQNDFLVSVRENKLIDGLVDEIVPIGRLDTDRVIKVYNSDYFARMTEALGENFESLWFVLGDEGFFDLCRNYIKKFPSSARDLANYGNEMPKFLQESSYIEEWPFLRDLAEFELNFWKMFHSDYPLVESSILDPLNLSETRFSFENIILHCSDWDVVSIWRNRESVADEVEIDWERKTYHLIFRNDVTVHLLELSEKQYSLLFTMQSGNTLGAALEVVDISGEEVQDLFSKLKSQKVPLASWDMAG